MGVRKTQWTSVDGHRLASERRRKGHTQKQCAAELRALGATAASQGTVSNWEVARTGPTSEETLSAIAAYCGGQADTANHYVENESITGDAAFEDVVARLVGSRPLSDRQARLIDALLARLETGPQLTPDDGMALRFAAAVLGLSTR